MSIMNLLPPEGGCYDANRNPLAMKYGLTFLAKLKTLSSREIPSSIAGVGMETLDRDTYDPATLYEALGQTGCKYARLQTGWLKCEKIPGIYDFKWLDDQVDNLLAIGVQPWLSASFGNPLYTPVPAYEEYIACYEKEGRVPPNGMIRGYVGEVPYYHGEKAMRGWTNYLQAMAHHFVGRVKYIEIWNEPDCAIFWRHDGKFACGQREVFEDALQSAEDYMEFLRKSVTAIREAVPAMKIAADVSHPGSLHNKVASREKLGDIVDVFAFHNYGTTPEHFTFHKTDYLRALIVDKANHPIEFWQGEAGRSTSAHHAGEIYTSEYTQAKFVTRRMLCDLISGMNLSSIFTLSDLTAYFEDGSDQSFGLFLSNPVRPKLAAFAFQSMCTFLAGLKIDRESFLTVTPPDGNVHSSLLPYNMIQQTFTLNGYPALTAYVPEDIAISVNPIQCEVTYRGPLGYKFQKPVIVDPIRQNIYRMDPSLITMPGWANGGVVIAPISFVDYPLFITELDAL